MYIYKCIHIHKYKYMYVYIYIPPKELLGGGVPTPHTLFCLICTINSELMYCSSCTTNERAGVDICWFPVDGVRHPLNSKKLFVRYTHTHI